jgi:hypothetical protein
MDREVKMWVWGGDNEIGDSVVGVAGGRDATDAFHQRAKGKMRTRKKKSPPEGPRGPGHNIGAG